MITTNRTRDSLSAFPKSEGVSTLRETAILGGIAEASVAAETFA
jgi:hypothetical protein